VVAEQQPDSLPEVQQRGVMSCVQLLCCRRWYVVAGEACLCDSCGCCVLCFAGALLVLGPASPLTQLCALVQGVDDEDLVCVAIDALVQAAGTFSAERGTRLLTYAWFYIMRDLTDALRLQVSE